MMSVTHAECHICALYAECRYAECHYTEWHYAMRRGATDIYNIFYVRN